MKDFLNSIHRDKLLHLVIGVFTWSLSFSTYFLVFNNATVAFITAFAFSVLIAFGIEIYQGTTKSGNVEAADTAYVLVGSLVVSLPLGVMWANAL